VIVDKILFSDDYICNYSIIIYLSKMCHAVYDPLEVNFRNVLLPDVVTVGLPEEVPE